LGYQPKSEEKYDIGFNYLVGNKWPLKGWPMENWKAVEAALKDKYSISWQQGKNNIEEYFEWINSCRLLVTNDSFGMHVALALKKKVIALFGPTHASDNYLYGLGVSYFPKDFACKEFPCQIDKCIHFNDNCMSLIKADVVKNEIEKIMNSINIMNV